MSTIYCRYPPSIGTTVSENVVQGPGVPGTPTGGVLTVQGDPAGTPLPVTGTVTATFASVGLTGAAVPASADYVGYNVSGNLTGATGTASGLNTVVNAALPAGTNKIGALTTVDTVTAVTTVSTVTSVTNVAAQAAWTTATAAYQAEGAVAFGSITNSYVTLFTPTAATKVLWMRNNMNASVAVSMDAGSTTNFILDAGDQMSVDLLANALNMGATAIQVKYAVGAPSSGSFRINGVH